MVYKGIMICAAEVGRELTPEEIDIIKKEIDERHKQGVKNFLEKLLTNEN